MQTFNLNNNLAFKIHSNKPEAIIANAISNVIINAVHAIGTQTTIFLTSIISREIYKYTQSNQPELETIAGGNNLQNALVEIDL